MKYLPAVFYHLLPVIPLALGFYYVTGGAVLLVLLAYIKVHKLRATEIEQQKKTAKVDPTIGKALVFWESLTFLKPSR